MGPHESCFPYGHVSPLLLAFELSVLQEGTLPAVYATALGGLGVRGLQRAA